MKRDIEHLALSRWKGDPERRPLLIRGARQVGKTYAVRSFAKEYFENLVEINFELQPELKKIFQTLDPTEIVSNISIILKTKIEPGKTLLFLDEIQECPQAIMALRYFYENLPALHVIGAGSLLEFCLSEKGFRMPVGRIQYLHLQPLSFEEFLTATGDESLRETLQKLSITTSLPESIHDTLLKRLRQYLLIGGMPAVVRSHLRDRTSYQDQQTLLLQTYRDDFGKYASRSQQIYLQKIFSTAPNMVGRRYKYSRVDPDIQSRDLKEAVLLLSRAGIINKVISASGHGLPLQQNEKKFKIIFLDVGLMQRGCGLDVEITTADDLMLINAGTVTEQFVGQELLAYTNPYQDRALFFWARDKKSSQAEIDYLIANQSQIVPIEVKSGKTGKLRSLRLFMKEHEIKTGIRLSQQPLSFHDQILSIPLYAISQLQRLLNETPNIPLTPNPRISR